MTGRPGTPDQPQIGGAFRLTDHHGREVTELSYHGKHVLLFFGFTHCRMVCPRALTKLSGVLDSIGELADRVQALYVTVDPERDSPEMMRAFLESYPRFTGLTGTRAQIDDAKSAFKVFARRAADPLDDAGYSVPHTAIAYLMDSAGSYVTHFPDALDAEEIRERLVRPLAHAG
jgi:protein SCO1/2